MLKEFPLWWPEKPPIYDIYKTYLQNLEEGPFFEGFIPERNLPSEDKWIDFLGFKVAAPLGVPAGPLLNSRWVSFAAEMGFDIVTYKTIRSAPHPAHPAPNMIYVDAKGQLTADRFQETLKRAHAAPPSMEALAATNSFGIPSLDAESLIEDIAIANASLSKGQVMIVSVVGTPRPGEDFPKDFAKASSIALQGGAKIIEADFSCPNVSSCEGSIYTSPQAVFDICTSIKKRIGSIPLIIKVGVILDKEVLKNVLISAAKAGAQGVCGINTISMNVVDDDGKAALGEKRLRSGVCGSPIRQTALDFVRLAKEINKQEKLGMTILATGGVITPEHFNRFFEAGADVAMSAVGMMWDPYLAARYLAKEDQVWKKN